MEKTWSLAKGILRKEAPVIPIPRRTLGPRSMITRITTKGRIP
jgi:hypothetical protein